MKWGTFWDFTGLILTGHKSNLKLRLRNEVTTEQQEAYWQAQVQAIQALKRIGIHYQLNDRIQVMKAFRVINKFWQSPKAGQEELRALYITADAALTVLVALRINGLEPPHRGTRYD